MDTWSIRKTKPIQSQLKPIQSQLKPIKANKMPKQTQTNPISEAENDFGGDEQKDLENKG